MTLSLMPPLGRFSLARRSRRRVRGGTFGPLMAVAICAAGIALGVGSAWWALDHGIGFESIELGAWTAWPTAGSEDADPYLKARLARSGEFVLSAAEGVALTATTDDAGAALLSSCTYRVAGKMPGAQWWTLTVYRDSDLGLMSTPAERTSLRSDLVLREPDDSIVITVSPEARGGNWLPVDPQAGAERLVLRLYDTPLATGGKLADADMPKVELVSCD